MHVDAYETRREQCRLCLPPSVQYLPTDSVICHDEPGPLAERQKEVGGGMAAALALGSAGLGQCWGLKHRGPLRAQLLLNSCCVFTPAASSPLHGSIVPAPSSLPLPRPAPQLYAPVLQWAQREMGIRLEPTESIFGATLGEKTLEKVEKHLQVGSSCGC